MPGEEADVQSDPVNTMVEEPSIRRSTSTTASNSFSSSSSAITAQHNKPRTFVALINTKSGAQKGKEALKLFRSKLGRDRVLDLVELGDVGAWFFCPSRFPSFLLSPNIT